MFLDKLYLLCSCVLGPFLSHHFFFIAKITIILIAPNETQTYLFLTINWLNLGFPHSVAKPRTKFGICLCPSTIYCLYFGQVTPQFATQYGRDKLRVVNFVHNFCFMLIVKTVA